MGAKASRCLELAPAEDDTQGPKNPGPFERLHDDYRRVVHCNTFEGVKFDVSKPLTSNFTPSNGVAVDDPPAVVVEALERARVLRALRFVLRRS